MPLSYPTSAWLNHSLQIKSQHPPIRQLIYDGTQKVASEQSLSCKQC